MTNEDLKALALAATPGPWQTELTYPIVQPAYPARGAICSELTWPDAHFIAAANPAAVLGLIADIERLNEDRERIRSQRMEYASKYEQAIEDCDQLKAELEQAKADGNDVWGLAQGRADTIDQLKAELATERQRRWDGNESTSREHAEEIRALKAECEGLRKDAERANYWKQRAKSAEGHLFAGDWRAAALELHRYSRFESTPWPELTDQQRALICGAAGAVIGCVNAMRAARKPKDGADTGETVWCACGDGHAANSYGAGFMAANGGVCENCDAAQPKVSCPLELFEGLRDAAAEEAAQHRQCMGSYRPHRQELLDAVVRQCDELIAGATKEASNG